MHSAVGLGLPSGAQVLGDHHIGNSTDRPTNRLTSRLISAVLEHSRQGRFPQNWPTTIHPPH